MGFRDCGHIPNKMDRYVGLIMPLKESPMAEKSAPGVLLPAPEKPVPPAPELIVSVARKYGVSPFRQFFQMMRLRMSRNRLGFHEYYSNQVYHPDISADERHDYVGSVGSWKLNERLSPLPLTRHLRAFVREKVLYGAAMKNLGFRTPDTQAVVSVDREYGNIPTLRGMREIRDFLCNDARYPVFVKPEVGSGSVGSALITDIDRDAQEILLSNGTRADLDAFAKEAFEDYSGGLIFQSAIEQHQKLHEIAGRAVATLRIVTVIEKVQPQVLYALWKIPAPKAMSDNYWQPGSMVAEINRQTGQLLQCRRGSGLEQEDLLNHPLSGKAFKDVRIPFWNEMIEMTTKAHLVLPKFGVFGWDVAITEGGPIIIECNANPHHMLYQLATGKGILNKEFAPVFDGVAARGNDLMNANRAKRKRALKKAI